jgi:FlaA1/EpsC-like NDP-sugar epimerase
MNIPEAVQLVIQTGAMSLRDTSGNGRVLILNMGEPVKIINLAHRNIELSGLTLSDDQNHEGDIELVVTGLRPGEKLYN